MATHSTRRDFLRSAGLAAGVGAGGSFTGDPKLRAAAAEGEAAPAAAPASPNEKLNLACIGVGGRGGAHVGPAMGENLVAVCDASERTLQNCLRAVGERYKKQGIEKPLPRTFVDYRVMFDVMSKELDAVVVAIPDNHHAPATIRAIQRGKHVYCEKPLTHNIAEARKVAEAAREHKVATQMGNQGRAEEGWRLQAEYLWAGVLGNVKEVHTWTDRPGIAKRFWWPQGTSCPPGRDPIPPGLNWDVWLGPAKERDFVDRYKEGKFKDKRVFHPFVWRGWWDFGTGALGDIGCHAWSGLFTALKIEHPASVTLIEDTGDCTEDQYPSASVIEWEIPARGDMPPCKMRWYDGGKYPPRDLAEIAEGKEYPDNGTIIVTDKGKYWGGGKPSPIGDSKIDETTKVEQTIPRCVGGHFGEWITACKGGRPAFSNFDHAGPLTEHVLLGNLALKAGVGKKVEWDGPNLKVTNAEELNQWVSREYRPGWEV